MSTVLVTGANRGIGLALVQQLRARGDEVVAVCRDSSAELEATGARIETGIDVRNDDAVASLAHRLGAVPIDGARIDRLVLNAGVLERDTLDSVDAAAFERIRHQIEVNALGPLRVARALLPLLAADARIAIVTSRMGSMADNGSGGYYGYRMSKAAVNAAGRSLAMDLRARGITVVLLHPGYVKTDMTDRHGDVAPEQAARSLIERIDTLGIEHTGSFWHANGTQLPW